MTLHSKTCSTKHIERKPITLYEKTCLSVCRRRQCPIERGDPLEIDRGDPVSTETQKHRLGLCSTIKRSKFLQQLEPKKFNNEINSFFKDNYCSKIWNYVKLIKEVSLDTIARRNDSKDFQDAESVRSGQSHATSQPVSFPPHPIPGGMLSRCLAMPNNKTGSPSTWNTHGISGNVFANPAASSSAPYPQELNPWSSNKSENIHSSHAGKSEDQTPAQGQRCQSGPSAKNSVIFSEGEFSNNHGADQQRLQISDLHFDKFSTPATFACWKIRFKTEVCTCSQFPREAMLWIKEVEMVDSVDDLMSSSSVRGIQMPNFEVLDARIASALNRIIHNSHVARRISLEEQKAQKQDRFLRGRQIAYLIYEYFQVTGANDSVENYADLFTIVLRNDDIQEFDSKWDGIL